MKKLNKGLKVTAKDMYSTLNVEKDYVLNVRGYSLDNKRIEDSLDLSGLSLEEIGVITSFLDCVFDGLGMDKLAGAEIRPKNEANDL